jgi:hypothetical protein
LTGGLCTSYTTRHGIPRIALHQHHIPNPPHELPAFFSLAITLHSPSLSLSYAPYIIIVTQHTLILPCTTLAPRITKIKGIFHESTKTLYSFFKNMYRAQM